MVFFVVFVVGCGERVSVGFVEAVARCGAEGGAAAAAGCDACANAPAQPAKMAAAETDRITVTGLSLIHI